MSSFINSFLITFAVLSLGACTSSSNDRITLSTIFGDHALLILANVSSSSAGVSSSSSDEMLADMPVWPHLLCGPVHQIRSKGQENMLNDSLNTIFISKTLDTACFLTSSNDKLHQSIPDSSDIGEQSSKSIWNEILFPSVLKVDMSAIDYFNKNSRTQTSRQSSTSDEITTQKTPLNENHKRKNKDIEDIFDKKLNGDYSESSNMESLMLTFELTPMALKRKSSSYWSDTFLSSTLTMPLSYEDSTVFELLFHSKDSFHRDSMSRRLQTEDCTLPASVESQVGHRSFHIELQGLSDVCIARYIQNAVASPFILRVLVDSKPILFNLYANTLISSGNLYDDTYRMAGLRGKDQVIAIADSGLNDLSCFFLDDSNKYDSLRTRRDGEIEGERRKIIQYIGHADGLDDLGGHGTHVAGTVTGSSLSSYSSMDGIAPDAKISFFDIGATGAYYLDVPELYTSVFPIAMSSGARVHTNSWGSPRRQYSYQTYDVDLTTWENPDMLILFAGGNSGSNGPKSLGSPANAKNCVAVGASEGRDADTDAPLSESTVAWFSSIGPTFDGRYKPDVIAPGSFLMSAFAGLSSDISGESCAAGSKMGTSMATPVVAGIALQLRQYFMDESFWASICNPIYSSCQLGAFTPSGYLLKALLLHSGSTMKRYSTTDFDFKTKVKSFELGLTPDIYQGYGSIQLKNILPLANNQGLPSPLDLILWDRLAFSQFTTKLWEISFENNIVLDEIRITICWYDPPALLGYSGILLIHDLDIFVISPDGEFYWGNRDTYPGDYRNPNEQIIIPIPTCSAINGDAGNTNTTTSTCKYRVYVRCNSLSESEFQSIAVVMTTSGLVSGPFDVDFPSAELTAKYAQSDSSQEVVQNTPSELSSLDTSTTSESVTAAVATDSKQSSISKNTSSKKKSAIIIDSSNSNTDSSNGPNTTPIATSSPSSKVMNADSNSDSDSDATYASDYLFLHTIPLASTQFSVHETVTDVPDDNYYSYYATDNTIRTYDRSSARMPNFPYEGTLLSVSVCLEASKYANMSNVGQKVSGMYPYILSLIIKDPQGTTLQIGGTEWYESSSKLFYREWPRTWVRYYTGDHTFRSIRDIQDAELSGHGDWTMSMTLGYNAGNISLLFAPKNAPGCNFNILLTDIFGDGWGGLQLELTSDKHGISYYQPPLTGMKTVNLSVAIDDTMSIRVIEKGKYIAYFGYSKSPWEVYWVVKDKGNSDVEFIGGYQTTMELKCTVNLKRPESSKHTTMAMIAKPYLRIVKSENLKTAKTTCELCTSEIDHHNNHLIGNGNKKISTNSQNAHTLTNLKKESNNHIILPMSNSLNIQIDTSNIDYKLLSSDIISLLPPIFVITDTLRDSIFISGSLCDSHLKSYPMSNTNSSSHSRSIISMDSNCIHSLPNGIYIFRSSTFLEDNNNNNVINHVNANANVNTKVLLWNFCERSGGSGVEFSFEIIHGICIPGVSSNINSLMLVNTTRVLHLNCILKLTNIQLYQNQLTDNDKVILIKTLKRLLSKYEIDVNLISWKEIELTTATNNNNNNNNNNKHVLNTNKDIILSFGFSLSLNKLNIIGNNYYEIETLAFEISTNLQTSFFFHLFESYFKEEISNYNQENSHILMLTTDSVVSVSGFHIISILPKSESSIESSSVYDTSTISKSHNQESKYFFTSDDNTRSSFSHNEFIFLSTLLIFTILVVMVVIAQKLFRFTIMNNEDKNNNLPIDSSVSSHIISREALISNEEAFKDFSDGSFHA
eukprot:gene4992-9980_t